MTDVLTAIDDALDTGVAADDDPLTRELQELALVLRDDAPEPTPEFRERLDWRVESGFKKPRGSRRAWWQPLLQPAAALGLTAAAVLVVALAAGGLSSSNSDDGGGVSGAQGSLATDDSGGGGGGGGAAESDSGAGSAEPALSAPKESARSAGGADQSSATVLPPSGGGFAPGRSDRKIERSVGLELEMPVNQMARVADQVTAVTNRYGGFVLNSSVSTGEDGAGGDFDLRIPANRLRPAIRDLSALADVRTQSQTGRDVTREHVTAKDRLRSARAERRSLLRRLEAATTDEEAEAIRRRLDLVAGEINGLRAQLRNLRLRTDYSVVQVTLLAKNGDSGGAGGGSFDDALGDAGSLLVTVAGWIVRALAVALPLALLALAGWAVGRVVRRRQRESALA
jgi:Domain of unknown function (DUF4349)